MPAPLPEDDLEVAALVAWLDCFRDLLDRRYPPSAAPPAPEPKPWASYLATLTPEQIVTTA
jgi:hypothetical protein